MVEAPFLILQMLRWAMRLATTEEFAAIIAHWAFPGGWVARRINRRLGLPYTVTLHGADVFALRSRIFGRLRKKVLEDAAAVLPVSQDIASTIELDPDDPRVHVVPMGALLPSIDDRPVREEDQFLFVGRLAEKKGVDIAIRALAMCPKGRLLVVGSGPEEPALRNLTQTLNLTNRVTFAGRMEKADVFRALQRALALVIPSRVAKGGDKDGTPVVLAEAAATGTPVIASELAGLAEQVQPGVTGLLVTPESVEELASAMAMLLDHPEKAGDMGSTAREAFEYGPLNIRTTAQRYAEVLEQVLGADR